MTDILQNHYSQVKNPNPVFTPREGKKTLPFCRKLMAKAEGFTSRFDFSPQNVCSVSVCRLWSVTWFVTLTARKPSGATDAPAACLLRQPPRLKSGSLPER
ncbi:hypothetical protein ACP6EH_27090 (plasmid) [Klebsiella pneumoniae subsp. pneumoniae]|uniref:hypothetical protein n=1 Tax=Klebsiella pneumoniae TaxID=573 RepID=UPI003CF10D2F